MTYRPTMGENIDLFISPSWQKTAKNQHPQLTITGAPKKSKKAKGAKQHKNIVDGLMGDKMWMIVCSDESLCKGEGNSQQVWEL